MPIHANAPLLDPTSLPDGQGQDKSNKWPLVIFSHGLAGSRTAYSHICARIASSGKVVIVMEHRDGTATACFPKSETGEMVPKYYVHPRETTYGKENQWDMRMDQLAFRRFEVYNTYAAVKSLVEQGERGSLSTSDDNPIDWNFLVGKVNASELQMVGHSFGGATLVSSIPFLDEIPTNQHLSSSLSCRTLRQMTFLPYLSLTHSCSIPGWNHSQALVRFHTRKTPTLRWL